MRTLRTATEVIEELGGTAATARLTGRRYKQAVSNWKATDKLPTDTFLILRGALEEKGLTAPAKLWGMKEPAE
jgi:hypothetical protein